MFTLTDEALATLKMCCRHPSLWASYESPRVVDELVTSGLGEAGASLDQVRLVVGPQERELMTLINQVGYHATRRWLLEQAS
jgi:hypothetical protein